MGLACKITGHKWNKLPDGSDGCKCTRCGERRNEGHDWHFTTEREDWAGGYRRVIRGQFYVCSVCDRWETLQSRQERCVHDWDGCKCRLCGSTRGEGHDWNGCTCARCGEVRDEGHDWQKDVTNFGAKEHRRQCCICGRYETERHSFKHLSNCQRMCTVCGYTMTWHEFRRGECMTCGIDESDYYSELILSGKVKYDADEYSPVDGSSRKYGSHVKSASALAKIALSDKKEITSNIKLNCMNKLAAIAKEGGPEADVANKALFDLALKRELGWSTLTCARAITDPGLASDPRIVEVIRDMEQASIEYDNAMIAADSGIGRSG